MSLAWALVPVLVMAQEVDLSKIDRTIGKEPKYNAETPIYGLVVFGPQAKTRVWMALDQSKPDAAGYDVLYADLNGNGDLTEPEERHTERDSQGRFQLPNFTDPATGARLTAFTVRAGDSPEESVMVSVRWRGDAKMGGGYPEEPDGGYLKFAKTPADAPVLWANGDGPFRFQRWYSGELTIGGSDDFKVFVGQQGIGPSSFWAFQQHFLPASEGVEATLIYQDAQGQERRAASRLNDRC
jgi:hypothetical protein